MVPFDCAQGDTFPGKPCSAKICRNGSETLRKHKRGDRNVAPYGLLNTLPRAIIFRVYLSPSTESW